MTARTAFLLATELSEGCSGGTADAGGFAGIDLLLEISGNALAAFLEIPDQSHQLRGAA